MLRDMQKAAKKENRTLSELVRENFRRAQQQQNIDIYQFIRQMAPAPPPLQAIRAEAKRKGTDQLTIADIDREVAAVRRKHDKQKKTSKRTRR